MGLMGTMLRVLSAAMIGSLRKSEICCCTQKCSPWTTNIFCLIFAFKFLIIFKHNFVYAFVPFLVYAINRVNSA